MLEKAWNLVVTIKGFGDESADATKQQVFAVAAVFGTDDEWALAIREWLRRTRGLPFHATDCESQYANDSDPQKHKDALRLYYDLTQILARSHLVGFSVALNLDAYRRIIGTNVVADWAYYKALADVIGFAAMTARGFNEHPEFAEDVRLEFTFDSRLESNGTAGTMYTMLASSSDWAETGIFDTKIQFEGGPGKTPRLEMADLLARESMKELERKITKARPKMRGARLALEETQKFRFFERGEDDWNRLKSYVEQPESTALMNGFEEWLIKKGQINGKGQTVLTIDSWCRYLAWVDNRDAIAKRRGGVSSSER